MKNRTYCPNLKCLSIGEIKACLRDYESCTIYQRWESLRERSLVKSGLERFLSKYKFWEVQKKQLEEDGKLGIGAMTEVPGRKYKA